MDRLNVNQDPKLKEIVSKLVAEFRPLKIFLFGSRARGNATIDSDYDLLLIVDKSDLNQIKRMQKAGRILWDCDSSVDTFVYTMEEYDLWKHEFSSIPHTVETEGLELKVG